MRRPPHDPRRLRVGIDASRAFGPRPTGTERYATELIRALLAEDRHAYRLYARGRPNGFPDGADVVALGAGRLWTHTRLLREVVRRPPDVLFVPAHVLPLVVPCPAAVTVHDLGHRAQPGAHTRLQRGYLEVSTRHHVRAAAALIADSAATRRDLVRHYGADPGRVHVVHLGVDAAWRPPGRAVVERTCAELGLAPQRYVLHVGTLQPRKNLPRLIAAFARVAPDAPGLCLALAGGAGWGREDLREVARRHGVDGRVRTLGYVANGALPALYAGAAVVAVPSLHEGFGLPVLEAMACGAPVVASDTTSLPEVGGEAALYFDPLDVTAMAGALARVVGDPALRGRLGAAGRARAARFTWARAARETRRVLERAAGGSRP